MISRRNAILLTLFGIFLGGILVYLSPTFKNPNLDIEFWAYLAGIFIAILALILSIWQIRSSINHNKLSVRPHLMFLTKTSTEPNSVTLQLTNNGLGPAKIKNMSVYNAGTLVTSENHDRVRNTMKDLTQQVPTLSLTGGDINESVAVSSTHIITLAELRYCPTQDQLFKEFLADFPEMLSEMEICIEYESMYGELFELKECPFKTSK